MGGGRRKCDWCQILLDHDEAVCDIPFLDSHEHGHLKCLLKKFDTWAQVHAYIDEQVAKESAERLRQKQLKEEALSKLTEEERRILGI